jgi:hypothetical protein
MNLQFYLEKLHSSEEFQKFIKENSGAYFCSGFFAISSVKNNKSDEKNQVDYFVPSSKKMFSFELENEIKIIPMQVFDTRIPEEISATDIDFEEIEEIIQKEIEEKNIKTKIQKSLLSLQKLDGKDFLVGTIFISNLGILRMNIDLKEKKVVLFEKKSFLDFIKKS